jgi:hypothetical protein
MARLADKDRVFQIPIKTELGLGDDRYTALRDELLGHSL